MSYHRLDAERDQIDRELRRGQILVTVAVAAVALVLIFAAIGMTYLMW